MEYPDVFHQYRMTGLNIVVGRTVFYSHGLDTVSCPVCRTAGNERAAISMIDEWYQGEPCELACESCGEVRPVTEWNFDPPWGFGYLGFTFWNWTILKKTFVDEVRQRLGHRIVFVADKM